jgi:hypothetical protein
MITTQCQRAEKPPSRSSHFFTVPPAVTAPPP